MIMNEVNQENPIIIQTALAYKTTHTHKNTLSQSSIGSDRQIDT